MESAVDETERSDSESADKGTDGDVVNEDENPQENRGIENIVKNFSAYQEGARAVAHTESDHLDEGQNHSEDVKLRHEDLNEGNQQKRDNDDPLSFHHESTTTVFFKELPREERDDHLQKVQIDKD